MGGAGMEIPMWLLPTLNGLLLFAVSWSFAKQSKRNETVDECIDDLRETVSELKLTMAKEYFSSDQAAILTRKLDQVIEGMHQQNVTLTEVKTELRATRNAAQMTASAAAHPSGHS